MLGIPQNIQGSNRLLSDSVYKGDKEAHYLIMREKKKNLQKQILHLQ